MHDCNILLQPKTKDLKPDQMIWCTPLKTTTKQSGHFHFLSSEPQGTIQPICVSY
jgi:hypothetical protein